MDSHPRHMTWICDEVPHYRDIASSTHLHLHTHPTTSVGTCMDSHPRHMTWICDEVPHYRDIAASTHTHPPNHFGGNMYGFTSKAHDLDLR